MTVDHLFRFADEAEGRSALPGFWNVVWRGDCCIPGVSVYEVTGTETITDPDTGQIYEQETRQPFADWWIVIALPALDPNLRDLPGAACQLIADREAAARGDPNFLIYLAPDIEPLMLSVCRVEPTFAGSEYPFGS